MDTKASFDDEDNLPPYLPDTSVGSSVSSTMQVRFRHLTKHLLKLIYWLLYILEKNEYNDLLKNTVVVPLFVPEKEINVPMVLQNTLGLFSTQVLAETQATYEATERKEPSPNQFKPIECKYFKFMHLTCDLDQIFICNNFFKSRDFSQNKFVMIFFISKLKSNNFSSSSSRSSTSNSRNCYGERTRRIVDLKIWTNHKWDASGVVAVHLVLVVVFEWFIDRHQWEFNLK